MDERWEEIVPKKGQLRTPGAHGRQIGHGDLGQPHPSDEPCGRFAAARGREPLDNLWRNGRVEALAGQRESSKRHSTHVGLLGAAHQRLPPRGGQAVGQEVNVPEPQQAGRIMMVGNPMDAGEEQRIGVRECSGCRP